MKKKGIRWAVAIWAVMIVVTGAWLVSASAENATFRDVKLENALKSALNTTTLTAAKLESLTTLDLSDKGITDLTGLEKAKNLKNISLRGNQISDISALAPLTLLETIDLTENQVRSLEPLSGLNN